MDVLYFAWVRERIGLPKERVETAAATVADLVEDLKAREDRYAAGLRSFALGTAWRLPSRTLDNGSAGPSPAQPSTARRRGATSPPNASQLQSQQPIVLLAALGSDQVTAVSGETPVAIDPQMGAHFRVRLPITEAAA